MSEALSSVFLVDAHVHLRPSFDVVEFLNRASDNFARIALGLGTTTSYSGVLMLAESAGEHGFKSIAGGAARLGAWCIRATGEEVSVVAEAEGRCRLILVAGSQIVTAEGLEVLALGSPVRHPDGGRFRVVLADAIRSGATAVVPYGVGKWTFGRGALVRSAVESAGLGTFFLGDTCGRPRWAGEPRLFRMARDRGLLILPGSDPMDWGSEVRRVGSCGFVLDGTLDRERPAAALLDRLHGVRYQPGTFGSGAGPWRLLLSQARCRLRGRRTAVR